MATRITNTSGTSDPELDARFEQALDRGRARGGEPLRHVVAGTERDDGPVFERPNPSNAGEVERFLDEIEAGVVYVNRRAGATTGAWPGTRSFPGWKPSGSTRKGAYMQGFRREQSQTVAR